MSSQEVMAHALIITEPHFAHFHFHFHFHFVITLHQFHFDLKAHASSAFECLCVHC